MKVNERDNTMNTIQKNFDHSTDGITHNGIRYTLSPMSDGKKWFGIYGDTIQLEFNSLDEIPHHMGVQVKGEFVPFTDIYNYLEHDLPAWLDDVDNESDEVHASERFDYNVAIGRV